ncbi:MAG: MFS transporter [Anaerolineales bacterium]|nr:MFS transporter [Anaerolineales bacterium]
MTVKSTKPWQRPFFQVWGGQALSLLGSQLVQFALVWHLTRETGSATVLATATLIAMLPMILVGPLAGSVIDRSRRKQIMLLADSGTALATLALAALFALGLAQVWHIYVVMLLRSLGQAFHGPAFIAATSLMVPDKHLARIQGINQTLNGGMNVLAAPLGALLLEVLPMQSVLAIDVVTALVAVLALLPVAVPEPKPAKPAARTPSGYWGDFREGLRYVRGWPGLMIALLLSAAINFLFTPAGALLPLLVTEHFKQGVLELGWMKSLSGLGIILGGLLLGAWGGFKKRIVTSCLGLIGLGVAYTTIGAVPPAQFIWTLPMMLLGGLMLPLSNGGFLAALQTAVEPDRQGRVLTLVFSISAAMSPLGLMVAGPVTDAFGVQLWYLLCGILLIGVAVALLCIPSVMNLEAGHPQKAASANPKLTSHIPGKANPA